MSYQTALIWFEMLRVGKIHKLRCPMTGTHLSGILGIGKGLAAVTKTSWTAMPKLFTPCS